MHQDFPAAAADAQVPAPGSPRSGTSLEGLNSRPPSPHNPRTLPSSSQQAEAIKCTFSTLKTARRATARRHRPGPRRLAPCGRHGRRRQHRHRLDREARRQLGPLWPRLRSQDQHVLAELRITDAPGTDSDAVLAKRPTAPSGSPGKRGPTARRTSCLFHSTRPASRGSPPSRSATRRPMNGRPRSRPTRVAGFMSPSTLIRPVTTTSCSARAKPTA